MKLQKNTRRSEKSPGGMREEGKPGKVFYSYVPTNLHEFGMILGICPACLSVFTLLGCENTAQHFLLASNES
jgi:hypothetical protein